MGTPITSEQFRNLLAGFQQSWFKFECQPVYAMSEERVPVYRFLRDGTVLPPARFPWWQEWLNLMTDHAQAGHMIQRVLVFEEPPTPYQRYLLAVTRWHEEAGEQITYLPRSAALAVALPLGRKDWHLFDDTTAVTVRFTPEGGLAERLLTTDPDTVEHYRALRDLALRHAAPARDVAAA
jgi:hypothetical protein